MRFGLLGPLTIVGDDGRAVEIRAPKVRVLAAALLCHANRPVTADTLIDTVWGTAPPRQAGASLRVYVHHLRQAIGADRIDRQADGYRLAVHADELDVERFHRLVDDGRRAAARQDLIAASDTFRAALELWRGPALAGFEYVAALADEARTLEELRLDALEQRFEVELSLARYAEVYPDLRALATRYPLRESVQAQLMRALVGCGRSAEAVAVFEETRRLLAAEFGVDPGPRLRELHLAILREDVAPMAGASTGNGSAAPAAATDPGHAPERAAPPVVPRQLPADLIGFSGRAAYLRQLDTLLPHDGGRATRVAAISGTAGVGKTALAVHWAHRVADRFPDGQLYVNLHGFDPVRSPMDPAAAIALFLGALGVEPKRIPSDMEARESLYRSVLADRRVLVVLDNAHDAGQVRPLLPGSAGCCVLVTSRNLLTGLVTAGAQPIVLDVLTDSEAGHLLRQRLGPVRTAAEPEAVDEIIARCAGLPLPLSIVASRAVVMNRFPLSAVATELADSRRALDGFSSDDVAVDLRAVFSWSYRVLSAPAARLFRLLALHPGPDASAAVAASLLAVPIHQARPALGELTAANLLREHSPGRYAYHDLLRAYAGELAETHDPPAERRDALRRVLDHYLHTANPATTLLDSRESPVDAEPPLPGVTPEVLRDTAQAVTWFTTEHAVLMAVMSRPPDEFDDHTWRLGWSLAIHLDHSGRWQDKLTVHGLVLAAARRAGNRAVAARTMRGMGRTYGRLRRYKEAHRYSNEALVLYRELDDRTGQAHALGAIAEVLEFEGRHREALDVAGQMYELYRAVDNRTGQAQALNNTGYLHALLGEYEEAVDAARRALELFVATDDRAGQGAALDSLGYAYQNLGRYDEAIAAYLRALDALSETGFRYFRAITLTHLGDAHHTVGDLASARRAWQRAVTVFTELGVPEAADVHRKLAGEPQSLVPTPT